MNGPTGSGELPSGILDLYPDNPGFMWITGNLHVQLEKQNAAVHMVSEARRSGDRCAEAEGLLAQSDGSLFLIDGWRERGMDSPDPANLAREAAAIFHDLHDNAGEARAYCAQGKAWQAAGFNDELKKVGPNQVAMCYKQALADWQDAERLADTAGECEIQAQALEGSGEVLTLLRRNAAAVEKLQHSIKLFRDADNTRGSGTAISKLGLALLRLKRYDEAADACREAIALCRMARELDNMRTAQVNLSHALLKAGRYQETIAASGDALATCEEVNYEDGVTSMLANLGFACLKVRQYQESVTWHKQLLKRTPKQNHILRAQVNKHIGSALMALESEPRVPLMMGVEFYEAAANEYLAAGDHRNAGISYLDIGEEFIDAQFYQKGIAPSGRAADLLAIAGDRETEARARVRLGQAYSSLDRWEEADKAFRSAFAVAKRCGDHGQMVLARTLRGGNLVDSGHPKQALRHLRWGIKKARKPVEEDLQEMANRFLGIAQAKLERAKGGYSK